MTHKTKRCTASQAFAPNEEDKYDAPPAAFYGAALTAEEMRQNSFVFLHDILNSAGGLHGYLELMAEIDDPAKLKKYAQTSLFLCDSMIEEIEYHREFLRTESGHYHPILEETKTDDILELTSLKLETHAVTGSRKIEIADSDSELIKTDKVLLSRILMNMTKNAIEATDEGGSVQIGAMKCGDYVRFWVHNSAYIPEDIQKNMFSTHFSTKGSNRGIGMLSIRVLGEKALNGHVRFESTKEKGTLFSIDVPANM